MRALILGGTGFLSSAIANELRQADWEVTLLTRGARPNPEGFPTLTADRHDPSSFLAACEGGDFSLVVDCLCFTAADADLALRAFGGGRAGRYVMISTDFVYGPRRRLPMDEDTDRRALSEYGRAKVQAEDTLLAAWRDEGFPVTILRPPHILGAGGHLGTGSLEGRDPTLLDRIARRKPVVLLDGGTLLIQPVYHRDVGRACLAASASDAAAGRAYNVAGPDCITTAEYYDLVAAALGVDDPEVLSLASEHYLRRWPEKAPFAQHRMYTVDRLAEDTGFRPATTLSHAIFETIDWLQASGAAAPYEDDSRLEQLSSLHSAHDEALAQVLGSD